jgi:hypothetical protein
MLRHWTNLLAFNKNLLYIKLRLILLQEMGLEQKALNLIKRFKPQYWEMMTIKELLINLNTKWLAFELFVWFFINYFYLFLDLQVFLST